MLMQFYRYDNLGNVVKSRPKTVDIVLPVEAAATNKSFTQQTISPEVHEELEHTYGLDIHNQV
jgi:hypothetical protein